MSIIRAPRPESNFYMLNKSISEDQRLTWQARGMLVFLLGKPDHWKVSVAHLRNETKQTRKPLGRDGVYAVIDELIDAGYITRIQGRGEGGKMAETTYLVSEIPVSVEPTASGNNTPRPSQPEAVEPPPVIPTQVSIDSNQALKEANYVPADAETPAQDESIKYEKIRNLYNQILGGKLPRCLGLNDKHRKNIKAAHNLKLDGKFIVRDGGLEFWEGLFHDVLESPFLLGTNNRAWQADFAFLTTSTKIQSFMEGKYDAR